MSKPVKQVTFSTKEIGDVLALVAKCAASGQVVGQNTWTRALITKCELAFEIGKFEVMQGDRS